MPCRSNTYKNNDCANDQFGSDVAFRRADIPRLFAFNTSPMNRSKSSSTCWKITKTRKTGQTKNSSQLSDIKDIGMILHVLYN